MIANSTAGDIVQNTDPIYSIILIAWLISFVNILECLIIINYLLSKPPLSQTIMDFMNAAFFIGAIPWSILMSLCATLFTVFQDPGEILGSLVAYSTPAFADNLIFQLTAIFIVQTILSKKPSLLENEKFDSIVKCVLAFIIPIYVTCLYLFACVSGIRFPFYTIVRGMEQISSFTWPFIRLIAMLPLLIAFIISRGCLRLEETGRNERSNHILNTTGVLMVTIGHLLVGTLVYFMMEIKKSPQQAKIIFPFGSLTIGTLFCGMVIFSHQSIWDYMCRIYPLNIISRRFNIRRLRQVANTEPLHELKL